jgi:hypothetical protein
MSDEIKKSEFQAPVVEQIELSDVALDKVAGGGWLQGALLLESALQNLNKTTKTAVDNTRVNS